ncbi:uncharacterized protein LOC128160302 [Crassostrea angulata]|uniref:uncharacterized protein LOC128160302 n=1 Tax=Magallana angulata TaxID=2784310 RepID=UPI0022B10ADE|nr:uncharacterized protein LOC128160302 [Crassostrea angulata]
MDRCKWFVNQVFWILLFITISRATLCNLQTERRCLYESLKLFSVYQKMVCIKDDSVQTLNFSPSCGSFCKVNIKKCSEKYDKRIGVVLNISSSNLSIESKTKEDIAFLLCNFSTLTNKDNDTGYCNEYSTTQIEPQTSKPQDKTSNVPDSKTTQQTRTTQPSLRMNFAFCAGNIVGAVIGGVLLGTTITAIIFVFIHRNTSIFQKSNLKSKFDVMPNPVNQQNDEPLEENPQPIERKNVVYNEVNDDIQNSVKVQPVQQHRNLTDTNVYNRLNESDQEDRSDYYDHAQPTPSLSDTEDGYGSLFVEQDVNDNYSEVDQATYHVSGNEMTVGSKQNNNYSTLEANN